jgi:hypothetical protein
MHNKWIRILLIGIGALLALCVLLGAGVFVVRLSSRPLARSQGLFRRIFDLPHEHGAIGRIQNIRDETITLQLRDGSTQNVVVSPNTRIERSRRRITLTDLHINDRITVIGSPDNRGDIDAQWIHVFGVPGFEPHEITPTPQPTRVN